MNLLTLLYIFCLFFVFIPGNVIKLPMKMNKMTTIIVHALLFSAILTSTYDIVEGVNVLGI